MSDTKQISAREGFQAMVEFLSAYWERGKSEEIAALLGSLTLQSDGECADPALWSDWLKSVEKVVALREQS